MESQEWGDRLDISTVGEMNDKVTHGGIQDILLIQHLDALGHSRLADAIYEKLAG